MKNKTKREKYENNSAYEKQTVTHNLQNIINKIAWAQVAVSFLGAPTRNI